jgi:hypothetical protein
MTYPVVPGSSQKQGPGPYPSEYPTVRPEDIAPYNCDHDAGVCSCVHDWRILWGNPAKKTAPKATYIQ